jgi:hypothetical protein
MLCASREVTEGNALALIRVHPKAGSARSKSGTFARARSYEQEAYGNLPIKQQMPQREPLAKGSDMTTLKLAIGALITAGLLAAPFAAEAKKYRSSRHYYNTSAVAPAYGGAGALAVQPRASYGSSGQTVGTVTAPSVGTYNWPSVGVTNSVPTWSNTNPR